MLNPMVLSDLVTYKGVTIVILFMQATIATSINYTLSSASVISLHVLPFYDLFKCRSHLEWNRFNIVRKFNCARNLYTGCRCLIDYLSVGLSMNWSFVKIIVLFEGINTRINRPKYEYESFIFCFSIRQVRIHFIIRHTFFLNL